MQNKATATIRKAKKGFEKKLTINIKGNQKSFWKYVRSRIRTKSTAGNLKMPNRRAADSEEEKAMIFNSYFHRVFMVDVQNILSLRESHYNEELQHMMFEGDKVLEKLRNLNVSKTVIGYIKYVLFSLGRCFVSLELHQ